MSALGTTIGAQESVLRQVLELDVEPAATTVRSGARVWLVGTGTSQHAAELGAQMLEAAGLDARWEPAARFARRRSVDGRDAVVLISHTGETAFARASRQRALDAGCPLVSITGSEVGWPEALRVAPRERSETYTASYTAALLALARIAARLGAEELAGSALTTTVAAAAAAAECSWPGAVPPARLLVVVGAGPAATTAREAALKVREAAGLLSEGYEAEYFLHGSAVPLDTRDRIVLLQPSGDPDGLVAAIGTAAAAEGVVVETLEEPADLDPLLLQIPLTIRLQRLAQRLAVANGRQPDMVIRGNWGLAELWEAGAPR